MCVLNPARLFCLKFSREEYWSGLPFPMPGDLLDPVIEPCLLLLLHCRQILYHWATWEAQVLCIVWIKVPTLFFCMWTSSHLSTIFFKRLFFPSVELLIYGSTIDFCILTLYPANLLNLFITSNSFLIGFLKVLSTKSCHGLIEIVFNSVQFSRSVVSNSLQPHESQHTRPPCPSPTPGVYSNSCPSSQWCHPAVSSSVVLFSSCPQSLPASGFFQWVNSSHEVAKGLEFQLHYQSFQWTPRTDLL